MARLFLIGGRLVRLTTLYSCNAAIAVAGLFCVILAVGLPDSIAYFAFDYLLFILLLAAPLLIPRLMPDHFRAVFKPAQKRSKPLPSRRKKSRTLRWLKILLVPRYWTNAERLRSVAATLIRAPEIVQYMREAMHAEMRATHDTEPLMVGAAMRQQLDQTAGIFQRYQYGSEFRRRLVQDRYRSLLASTHPAEKTRSPIDVGQHGPEGRLLALPIVINADNAKGGYDELDFILSDHERGHYVYRSTEKGVNMKLWNTSLGTITSYLGGRWRIAPRDGATLNLERLPEVSDSFALPPDALRKGFAFFGLDLNTGEHLHISLDKLSHTLIAGPTGMGKSVFLHQLMASIMFNLDRFEAVHLVDLKYGLELQDYPSLSDKFHLTATGAGVPNLLDTLLAEMDRRGAIMRGNKWTNWRGPLIMVVIDEFADMLLGADNKHARDSIANKLTRLTNLSRALGFRFWVQSQKFTADAVPMVVPHPVVQFEC